MKNEEQNRKKKKLGTDIVGHRAGETTQYLKIKGRIWVLNQLLKGIANAA